MKKIIFNHQALRNAKTEAEKEAVSVEEIYGRTEEDLDELTGGFFMNPDATLDDYSDDDILAMFVAAYVSFEGFSADMLFKAIADNPELDLSKIDTRDGMFEMKSESIEMAYEVIGMTGIRRILNAIHDINSGKLQYKQK